MKTQITKAFAFLFMAIVSTSCMIEGFNSVNGNRNVVTETRDIQDRFDRVKVGQGIELYITQESKTSIVVRADENLQHLIRTEVEDGVLVISSKRNIRRAKSKRVYLSVATINGIKATSGSDVVTEGVITADTFDASASSGADIRIEVRANTVNTNSTSGANLQIKGNANYHIAKASSGASIEAYGLESKNVIAKVSSGADIDVYASESITGKASSGGDIDYRGNPKRVDKKKSSGGSVSSH
jgi:hypothetical protein